MGKFINLIDQQFNRLKVIKRAPNKILPSGQQRTMWECICSCELNNKIIVSTGDLRSRHTQSCGCLWRESITYEKEYICHDDYCECKVKNGSSFIIDTDDFEKVSKHDWYKRNHEGWFSASLNMYLHQYILDDKSIEIDHKNRNRNDNRKTNLRQCTHIENMRNQPLKQNNTSGFIGVYFKNENNKWCAQITYNKRKLHLGYFENKENAIIARLKAEKELFKDFAPQRHLFKEYKI